MNYTRREFIAVTTAAGATLAAQRAGWSAPSNPMETKRPNFLFLLADQHRPDWLGAAGGVLVRTPNLDALAARGVRFTRAFCASPVCGPSRACLASGREYDRCGVPNHSCNYPLEQVTYYRLLRDAGYHVAGCGKFDLHKSTSDWGIDGQHLIREWGFSAGIDNAGKWDAVNSGARKPKDPYMAFLHARGLADEHVADLRARGKYNGTFPTPLPDDAYCDNWIGAQTLRLLREIPANQSWHLVVNFGGPHEPMDVTASMHRLYREPKVEFPPPRAAGAEPSPHDQEVRRNYSAMIENIDRWAGLLLQTLSERGELENTVVVYSSDHGEMLGDHGMWEKTRPYQASAGIPLIVAGTGVRAGVVSEALVSLIDVGATFLELGGVTQPAEMDSRSLRPVLQGQTNAHRNVVRSGLGPWRMVFDGRYKLVTGYSPLMTGAEIMGKKPLDALEPLLFDLKNDPLEEKNFAAAQPELVAALQRQLKADAN